MVRHLVLGCLFALVLCVGQGASAQFLRPYEPLDPAKAQSLPFTPLSIQTAKGKVEFQVEVADDDQERSTGLMHRTELAMGRGMLFDFQSPREVSFWMRNTFIPLDMIFIAADGTIRTIAENTIPHNDRGVSSRAQVVAVLELQAGASAKLGIKPGDKVTHAIFNRAK
jgi:uncharacterized protein